MSVVTSRSSSRPAAHRQQVRDALGAGVRAVRGAERVVDVDVGERGERARELGVVGCLARLEAHVLQQQDLARRRAPRRAPDARAPTTVRRELTGAPVSSRRRSATGASERSGSGLPSGRPRCETSISRAPRARSSSIVGSAARMRVSSVTSASVRAFVERHVEVDAHEHALAATSSRRCSSSTRSPIRAPSDAPSLSLAGARALTAHRTFCTRSTRRLE